MRWKRNNRDKSRWHKWFAWHPVVIENDCVWLETVERRIDYGIYDDFPEYRYATD